MWQVDTYAESILTFSEPIFLPKYKQTQALAVFSAQDPFLLSNYGGRLIFHRCPVLVASATCADIFMMGSLLKGALMACLLLGACARVSWAQLFPAAPEQAATVISLTGQVSVLHDSEPWALNVGDSVQVRQVIITGPDGFAQFQVADGSTFEVYPNSNVVFRKNPSNFRDLLDVLVGRVKLHIQKWGNQPNPNKIHTPTAVISVRGTTFEVTVDEDNESTVISVEEGQVEVRHALKGDTKTVNAGESITVYRDQPLARNLIDKGTVARQVIKVVTDALYTVVTNGRGGQISTGSGGGGSGQTGPPKPPPPPTPPPVPAPPH